MKAARCLVMALLAACVHAPRETGTAPRIVSVERDAVWTGEVPVDGIVHVRKGATLAISPGTRVLFSPARFSGGDEHGFAGAGIRVEGRIVANGTAEAPIVFTSAAGAAAPGSWDRIFFSFSAGNRLDHCVFEGARYAFHAHFSEIAVSNSVFRENEEGVRLGSSRVRIADSVFTRNAVRGINFRDCRNEITGNLVFGNGDGIFLHSKDAASVIRGNAVYANRGSNLRLGDLHEEDVDVSGNWWGTAREEEALRKVFDGRALAGIGRAKLAPLLPRPPVGGAWIGGLFTSHRHPVAGGEVLAFLTLEDGFRDEAAAAIARTGDDGSFRLSVPPGRYFVVGRAESSAGALFAFPGRNPVAAGLGETAEVGLPAVVAPPRVATAASRSAQAAIAARVTFGGTPVEGATVQAFRAKTPDFRGAGEASSVTGGAGEAILHLPPGRYHLAAKKRMSGSPLGMVEEGGLFGVYPHSPVDLSPGTVVSVEIPLFEKRGYLGDEERRAPPGAGGTLEGTATVDGRPAEGYVVHFYKSPETVGRPAARSSPISASGRFRVTLAEPGEYLGFLRRALPGTHGTAEEERIGPLPLGLEAGSLRPPVLEFRRRPDSR